MAPSFLAIPTRLHCWSFTCAAYRIPATRFTSTFANRPRALPSFPVPPARRNFEFDRTPPLPPVSPTNTNANTNKPAFVPARTGTQQSKTQIERRPTNRQIPFDHVFVIDPETNRLSRTKQSLRALLEVQPGQGRVIELVASAPEPVVRVTTRSEVEARYKEMKRALRRGAKIGEAPKEVQLTWGVAQADLEHKLRKAARDLEKGYRVAVVVTVKNRRRPSGRQELVAFADEISGTLRKVGQEWKEREFTGRVMVLSFRKAEVEDDGPLQ